jgi:glycine betaine/proline transport system substrate-binding protein
MLAVSEGAKPEQAAKDWVAKNPDRVAGWLK